MSRRRWISAGAGLYLLFLLLTLPTDLVLQGAQLLDAPPLRYAAASGTLWQGELRQLQVAERRFDRLSWDLHPSRLLLGELGGHLELRQGPNYLRGDLGIGPLGGIDLSGVEAQWRLTDLSQGTPLATFSPQGQLNLHLQQASLGDQQLHSLEGVASWSDAAIEMIQPMTLGAFRAEFTPGAEEGVEALIRDADGPVSLSAQLQLSPDWSYEVNGDWAPRGNAPNLRNLTRLAGRPGVDGRYPIQVAGQLFQ